jgi:hypothetical protein
MSDEWPEDDSPTGGIGTITRPPGPPRETPRRPYREPKGAPPSGLRSGGAWTGEEEGFIATREDSWRTAPGGERD